MLYYIKFNIKFLKVFNYEKSWIYKNNINKVKYLLFNQIKILLFKAFKNQLYIHTKLVKSKIIISISIIMYLSLTKKHNKGIIDINI